MAESLQAQAFVLMNEAGDTRATLALISDLPVLTLFDRTTERSSVSRSPTTPGTRGDGGWQDSESSLSNP